MWKLLSLWLRRSLSNCVVSQERRSPPQINYSITHAVFGLAPATKWLLFRLPEWSFESYSFRSIVSQLPYIAALMHQTATKYFQSSWSTQWHRGSGRITWYRREVRVSCHRCRLRGGDSKAALRAWVKGFFGYTSMLKSNRRLFHLYFNAVSVSSRPATARSRWPHSATISSFFTWRMETYCVLPEPWHCVRVEIELHI